MYSVFSFLCIIYHISYIYIYEFYLDLYWQYVLQVKKRRAFGDEHHVPCATLQWLNSPMSAAQHVVGAAPGHVGRIASKVKIGGGISTCLEVPIAICRLQSKKHVLAHHRILSVPQAPHHVQAVHLSETSTFTVRLCGLAI